MSMIYLFSWMGLILSVNNGPAPNQPAEVYGNATVAEIIALGEARNSAPRRGGGVETLSDMADLPKFSARA